MLGACLWDSAGRAGRCVKLGVRGVTGRWSRAAQSEVERSACSGERKAAAESRGWQDPEGAKPQKGRLQTMGSAPFSMDGSSLATGEPD